MIDLRLRTRIPNEEMEQKVGKIVTDSDYNVLLTGPTRVRKPDGSPLCVYLPHALDEALMDSSYATLHSLRSLTTDNRGLASGVERKRLYAGKRTYTQDVRSTIVGAFEAKPPFMFCRLTAWTGRELDKYRELFPLFQQIAHLFEQHVPDRYANQMKYVNETKPEWTVAGTPFSTITVNNTWPTGVHQDQGDLDEGFSCLAVLRKGDYTGGYLTFPEFRVSVNMGHGDLLLMDAHEWHGNTALDLKSKDAERISVVCYYRTEIAKCNAYEHEAKLAEEHGEKYIQQQAVKAQKQVESEQLV